MKSPIHINIELDESTDTSKLHTTLQCEFQDHNTVQLEDELQKINRVPALGLIGLTVIH